MPLFTTLLSLGLGLSIRTTVLPGTLPKPTIWADPGSVIRHNKAVSIWCQGTFESLEYRLHKEGSTVPWDRQYPLPIKNRAKFDIPLMTPDYAGRYSCLYVSPAGWSELSDTLELVMTGAYEKPSLSVLPSRIVTLGVNITFQCWSKWRCDTFILIQEGKDNLSFTLDSQHHKGQFQAFFLIASVTPSHNGTFRCYGYFRNDPQLWSWPSDPIEVLVSGSENKSAPTAEPGIENGLEAYQKVLIGVSVIFLLLFFLFLLQHWCKGKGKKADQREADLQLPAEPMPLDRSPQNRSNLAASIQEEYQYAALMDIQPVNRVEIDNQNPPKEDPQSMMYAKIEPSRLRKAVATPPSPLFQEKY